MKIIYAKDIVGKPSSDLVPNNRFDKVEWQEYKVNIEYSHTSEYGGITSNGDDIMFASNKIARSNPFDNYNGEIVSGTSVGRIAFYNFITPKNTKYYHVVSDQEPFGALYDADNSEYIGGEFNWSESYAQFKADTLKYLSSYFTHEIVYIEDPSYPYNSALSKVRLAAAVRLDKYSEYQLIVGGSADLYLVKRESSSKSKGIGKNLFAIESSELFQADTKIASKTIGEYIAEGVLAKYIKGKQTIALTVVVHDDLYTVGDIVVPYGFDNQPMSRKTDGTAKQFLITSAEFVYRGSYRQNLEMVEVT